MEETPLIEMAEQHISNDEMESQIKEWHKRMMKDHKILNEIAEKLSLDETYIYGNRNMQKAMIKDAMYENESLNYFDYSYVLGKCDVLIDKNGKIQ